MLDFEGRVAIVTGAGRGIGRAHALTLAARNCRVVVNDIPLAGSARGPAQDVVAEITEAGGMAIACEIGIDRYPAGIVAASIEAFGRLDILINNAGTTDHAAFEELTPERFDAQVDLHCTGAVNLIRAAWPHLRRSGSGRVINTSSAGIYGNAFISNYAAGKGALTGFSRCLAFEGEPYGITVNCIMPNGSTRLQSVMDARLQPILHEHFQPDRVAAFVAWLAHQDTTINNGMFEVGGNMVARIEFAQYPFLKVDETSPEAWADQRAALVGQGELTPIGSGIELLMRQLRAAEPAFDLDLSDVLEVRRDAG
jgi:NAD(P)-dependent dehydrogenase (short-subunit alcohol dehydrogenase family)